MIECAFTGAPAPFQLVEAMVIDKWHWTFEQLDNADAGRLLRTWRIINTYNKHYNPKVHESEVMSSE